MRKIHRCIYVLYCENTLSKKAHIFLSEDVSSELDSLNPALGKNRPAILASLLREYRTTKGEPPVGSFESIMKEQAPACITGLPGSGKSFTLHDFLARCESRSYGVFFIDTVGEYPFGLNISPLRALAFNPRPGQFRFVPEQDLRARRFTIRRLFERLSMLQVKGRLKDFVIAIDEANQFADIEQFRSFVIESRKFCMKVVLVSADRSQYEGLCRMMSPLPKA